MLMSYPHKDMDFEITYMVIYRLFWLSDMLLDIFRANHFQVSLKSFLRPGL